VPYVIQFMYPRYHVPYKICGAINKTAQKILTFPLTGPDFSLVIVEKSLLRPGHALTYLPVDLMLYLNTDGEDVNSMGNLQQQ